MHSLVLQPCNLWSKVRKIQAQQLKATDIVIVVGQDDMDDQPTALSAADETNKAQLLK